MVTEQRKRALEDQRRRFLEEARTVLAELGASAEECAPDEEESNHDGDLEDESNQQAENEGILNDNSTNRRKQKGYMPPKGSCCLYTSMEGIQQQMKRGKATFLTRKLAYKPSHADPVAASSYSPGDWYLSRFNHFSFYLDAYGFIRNYGRFEKDKMHPL